MHGHLVSEQRRRGVCAVWHGMGRIQIQGRAGHQASGLEPQGSALANEGLDHQVKMSFQILSKPSHIPRRGMYAVL
jgi:hypothetical protein